MKKLLAVFIVCILILTGCSTSQNQSKADYTIGICNYVDDASLNQITDNILSRIDELSKQNNLTIDVNYDNANADANLMSQIINNFIVDDVDLMVAIATPVAMNMQALTQDNQIPVVFAAVSDPVGSQLVDTLDKPGSNLTGTSDYLDTASIMNLIFALNPDIKKIGLLYDLSQDGSITSINEAKTILNTKGIEIIEKTGSNVEEIRLAAQSLINEKVEAIFTPSDNTVMISQLSIYESLLDAGIPHFAGADSFALNGSFVGYGVDYANLGRETADMIFDILVNKKDVSTYPVKTFDNGIVTINNEAIDKLGLDLNNLNKIFEPYCTKIQTIDTAEDFGG